MEYTQEIIEKHGKTNPETGEIEVDRQSLKREYVNRGVYILNEIDMLKSDGSQLLEDAKLQGFDKKQLKQLIDAAHKSNIREKIEELEEIECLLDTLFEEDVPEK